MATAKRPRRQLGLLMIAMVVTWFIYVPIHEFLHVLGCVVTGGSISELEISPLYGGALFARFVPFVVSGSDYAGRLSGFDTKGSDFCYLVTDFMPFVLTVLIGVPLIKLATRRRRPILFAIGIVVGLAPFYNIPGDYYEMGSTLTTRTLTFFRGGGNPPVFEGIRSDDVFLLFKNIVTQPGELGLEGAGMIVIAIVLAVVSLIVAILLAFSTYAVAHALWMNLPGARTRPDEPVPST